MSVVTEEPVQPTHYLCPEVDGTDVTHHLKPRRFGQVGGEPSFELACTWCGRTEAQLREDIAAFGGTKHPHIVATDPPKARFRR